MYPSMLRTAGDWFADFEQLQDRIDELLTGRSMTSSIRAVGRAGAFPALNVALLENGILSATKAANMTSTVALVPGSMANVRPSTALARA